MVDVRISEMLTYSTVQIKCEYNNGTCGSGTGFIINLCENKEKGTCVPVLVTNNHVVENSKKTVFEFCLANEKNEPVDTKTITIELSDPNWIMMFFLSANDKKKIEDIFTLISKRDVKSYKLAIVELSDFGYSVPYCVSNCSGYYIVCNFCS